jgi:hypothetical protein
VSAMRAPYALPMVGAMESWMVASHGPRMAVRHGEQHLTFTQRCVSAARSKAVGFTEAAPPARRRTAPTVPLA